MIRAMMRYLPPLLTALLLAACGQKGPLYLPDKGAAPVRVTPPVPATPGEPADRTDATRKQIH